MVMYQLSLNLEQILELVKQLPQAEKIKLNYELEKDIIQAENFDQELTTAYTKMSEQAFSKIWDNPEDTDYDDL
ncbi:MAG: toxin-antitoxin system, antitoxin component, Xre family protein [Cyanobacterium sp. T60_A2020_053]|nr:toxin-antitoxin system, antitoxin component, Xre family protein [Cyanobacterium sp. T60_A2020_053]